MKATQSPVAVSAYEPSDSSRFVVVIDGKLLYPAVLVLTSFRTMADGAQAMLAMQDVVIVFDADAELLAQCSVFPGLDPLGRFALVSDTGSTSACALSARNTQRGELISRTGLLAAAAPAMPIGDVYSSLVTAEILPEMSFEDAGKSVGAGCFLSFLTASAAATSGRVKGFRIGIFSRGHHSSS